MSIALPSMSEVEGHRFAECVDISALIGIVRSIVGPNWAPDKIHLRSALAASDAVREAFPSTRFVVGRPLTGISFDQSVLAGMALVDEQETFDIDAIATGQASTSEALRGLLRPYIYDKCPTIKQAAEISGLHLRTLQRQLASENSSYRHLIEKVRFDEAVRLLTTDGMPVTEIALMLGYADSSNFSRAFRRLSGLSPREFRAESHRKAA